MSGQNTRFASTTSLDAPVARSIRQYDRNTPNVQQRLLRARRSSGRRDPGYRLSPGGANEKRRACPIAERSSRVKRPMCVSRLPGYRGAIGGSRSQRRLRRMRRKRAPPESCDVAMMATLWQAIRNPPPGLESPGITAYRGLIDGTAGNMDPCCKGWLTDFRRSGLVEVRRLPLQHYDAPSRRFVPFTNIARHTFGGPPRRSSRMRRSRW